MDATTKTTAAERGRYFVKCDECRETMRYTDSMQESAAGGRCEKCRAPKPARKQRGATKAQLAYRAKLFAPASPSIHDDLAAIAAAIAGALKSAGSR
jgi:hypothetical protein